MLNVLRFDFYKIVKSKSLIWFWVLLFLLLLVSPVICLVNGDLSNSAVDMNNSMSVDVQLLAICFACIFCGKDYSSGYLKNIFTIHNKFHYIISKIIYIFAFCFLVVVLDFVLWLLFSFIFGNGVIYDVNADKNIIVSLFCLERLSEAIIGTMIGSFVMFLSSLIKKEYVVIILVLMYLIFFSYNLYTLVNKTVYKIFNVSFTCEKFSIFGHTSSPLLTYENFFQSLIVPDVIMPIIYITLFTFFSYLILKKRNV